MVAISLENRSLEAAFRAHYYSASLGRFLEVDPIGLEGGVNLYAYVGNNPLRWGDPLGLAAQGALFPSESEPFLRSTEHVGIKGTIAPAGFGPAVSVEIRNGPSNGADVILITGVGEGASSQLTPTAKFGLQVGVGEIGPVAATFMTTFPTGLDGTTATVSLDLSLFPLGTRFTGRAGIGRGQSAIVGIRTRIPLSAP